VRAGGVVKDLTPRVRRPGVERKQVPAGGESPQLAGPDDFKDKSIKAEG
jgi:hypothetical protein